jgi:hypothetical protein
MIRRADRRGRYAKPIAERTQIILRGGMLLGGAPDTNAKCTSDQPA